MIRCVVICPDPELRHAFVNGLQSVDGVALVRTLDHYPQSTEAGRLLDSVRPSVIFIEARPDGEAGRTCRCIEALAPDATLVGVAWLTSPKSLLEAMQIGLRDFVCAPFTPARLRDTLDRAADAPLRLDTLPGQQSRIYSFIPAKEGVGASHLAMGTALALSEQPGSRPLLMDFDASCSVTALTLGLTRNQEPEQDWQTNLLSHKKLDVLVAQQEATAQPSYLDRAKPMMRMARQRYSTIVADLPGQYDAATFEVLQRSHMVFLVTTPEVPSLRLAHDRLTQISMQGLADRVEIVINRGGSIGREHIEDVLGWPVYFEFPNRYRALNLAGPASQPGPMADHFRNFAATICGGCAPVLDGGLWTRLSSYSRVIRGQFS